jgi:hypothetical protein
MSRASESTDPAVPPDGLTRRLLHLVSEERARFLLVRSRHRGASAALIADLLDHHDGEARVVLHPSRSLATPYRSPLSSTRSWKVIIAADVPGSIDDTALSMSVAGTMVANAPDEVVMRALWLPPGLLEGYAQLPSSPRAILVVDDWHALVVDYLAGASSRTAWRPAASDLDPLLVEAFRALSVAHLIVVTTRSSPTLERGADVIVSLRLKDSGRTVEARLTGGRLETTPQIPYVLRLGPNGFLVSEGG